jgi:tRNA threonylcarbamoyladenosine biosynthesis protein TsaB
MILAIDTATQYAALALYNQSGLQTEETWQAGRNHTTELMPRIVRILQAAQIRLSDITALAVSLGPGSFTGLRIGLAVAKGLALPHEIPLVGVPTLEVTAYPGRDRGLPVWAIAQAGRGRILTACFNWGDDQWQMLDDPQLTSFQSLAGQIKEPALCLGEIDEKGEKILTRRSHGKARVASPAVRLRRAGYLAEIAAHRLEAGYQADAATLEPIYPSQL